MTLLDVRVIINICYCYILCVYILHCTAISLAVEFCNIHAYTLYTPCHSCYTRHILSSTHIHQNTLLAIYSYTHVCFLILQPSPDPTPADIMTLVMSFLLYCDVSVAHSPVGPGSAPTPGPTAARRLPAPSVACPPRRGPSSP